MADLIEEYYMNKQRLDYFLVIDEAHLLLQHISLIEITKEFDKVALISATADDIKHFVCFRDYIIVNPFINEKYNQNIYINKLISNVDEKRTDMMFSSTIKHIIHMYFFPNDFNFYKYCQKINDLFIFIFNCNINCYFYFSSVKI